ncbi:MAG: DegV family protein [Lachnospiraceae bacterium]|nr:DegV family protein [Lachnospiraceae bacterium]
MKKIAVVTDSNSGITQAEAKELNGIIVIPMPFTINEQPFLEDIDLDQDGFYSFLGQDAEVKTSQPAVGTILDLWNDLLKEYDEIVHIPMSSGLSGSCETARLLAEDFDGRVQVVNNQRISVTQRRSVYDARALADKGFDAAAIRNILEREKFESGIYIMVDTLKYLKKGGRVTPAAAAIASVFNIKPVLQIQGEKLDSFAKVRGIKQAKKVIVDQIVKDITNRVPGGIDGKYYHIDIAHTQNDAEALALKEELLGIFPGMDIIINPLSLSVSCHIGPGAIAAAWVKKVPELD